MIHFNYILHTSVHLLEVVVRNENWNLDILIRKLSNIWKALSSLLITKINYAAPAPCGYKELTRLALTPSLSNYQLLLVNATRGYSVTSFGKPQELVLLYANEHYDVITTLLGSLVTVISVLGVSNPTTTKASTPVKTTLIIVLPAYKQDVKTLPRGQVL